MVGKHDLGQTDPCAKYIDGRTDPMRTYLLPFSPRGDNLLDLESLPVSHMKLIHIIYRNVWFLAHLRFYN